MDYYQHTHDHGNTSSDSWGQHNPEAHSPFHQGHESRAQKIIYCYQYDYPLKKSGGTLHDPELFLPQKIIIFL